MKKFISNILAVIIVFCACLIITGCGISEPKTIEDYIPEAFGKAEGLYLYYDNYRCLTDGSNTERLLNDITVDGATYAPNEYSISQTEYITSEKEIFYSIKTQKADEKVKYLLWHYNYDTKENGLIRAFENRIYELYASEKYLFVRASSESALYDADLNLILDDLSGYSFDEDVVYAKKNNSFDWWKDGNSFSLPISGDRSVINGKYAYLLGKTLVYSIDLDTGEYQRTDFADGEYFFDSLEQGGRTAETGDKTYFITHTKTREVEKDNEILKTGCRLWSLQGLKAERIYTFPKKYEVSFSYDSNFEYINFLTREKAWVWLGFDTEPLRIWHWSAYYNLQKNEFKTCLVYETEYLDKIERCLYVGEYQFYVVSKAYGGFLTEYFYYLHRVKDGKDEIMQYAFSDSVEMGNLKAVLFDDIHEK